MRLWYNMGMKISASFFCRAKNALFASLLFVFAAGHGAETKSRTAVPMLPGENWWGLGSNFGRSPDTCKRLPTGGFMLEAGNDRAAAVDGTRYNGPAKIEVNVDLMRLPYFLREYQPVPIEEEKK